MNDVNLKLEDREFLASLPTLPATFRGAFTLPDTISAIDWHRPENQGPIGSCRGHSGTSVLERLAFVRGLRVQLSRIFFYLATQKLDGLLGRAQSGCTISRGFKLMLNDGCCLEELTGYPSSYPGREERNRILLPAHYAAGDDYKAGSVIECTDDFDTNCEAIAGGGAIDYGIPWYSGVIPRDRIVRRFNPPSRSGGHANCLLGYDRKLGLYEAWNSHRDGHYQITPEAFAQMLRHPYTAAGIVFGQADPEPINWSQERYL